MGGTKPFSYSKLTLTLPMFFLQDEKSSTRGQFDNELDARRALEDRFMCERNHNFYLFRKDGNDWKEIGRRVNSNRYGGPRAK